MKQKPKILYAEDEESLALIVKESLESKDFEVAYCNNGTEALRIFETDNPDILVLDIMMPKKDGFTVAKEVRQKDKDVPIILLTAKTQTKDVVEGFELGANDYLKKPFSIEELIVRINSLLNRRLQKSKQRNIEIGTYTFNHISQSLIKDDQSINLTHREAELLFYLSKNKNEILERSFILNKIWGDVDFYNARSMDVFITKLRKKLSKDSDVQIINVRGIGYKLIC